MASKEEYNHYAAELTQRFEELTKWAIAHWPRDDFPLLQSDFCESRREIGDIVGPKLGDPDSSPESSTTTAPAIPSKAEQYRDVNPMPWP